MSDDVKETADIAERIKKLLFDFLGDLDDLDRTDARIDANLAELDAIEAEGGAHARLARLRLELQDCRARSATMRQTIQDRILSIGEQLVGHGEALDAEVARRKRMS